MELLPGVHAVRTEYFGIYTTAYLIEGELLTLVDSGELESWDQDVRPYIARIGRDPSEVGQVLLTHQHDDHVGSARRIQDETGASVIAGSLTADFLARPSSIMEWEEASFDGWLTDEDRRHILEGTDYRGLPRKPRQPFEVDRRVSDGDIINAGAYQLAVLETPGHTVDSVSYYMAPEEAIFTGDAVSGEGTATDDLIVVQCPAEFDASLDRVAALGPALLMAAHPYLPLRDGVARGPDAVRQVEATRQMAARIRREIRDVLESTGPMTTARLSAIVCDRLGPNRPPDRSHGTIRRYLVEVLDQGLVRAWRDGHGIWWEPVPDDVDIAGPA